MIAFLKLLASVLLGVFWLKGSYAIKVSVSDLDNVQKNILEEFREKMEGDLPHDYMRSDAYLLKFLYKNKFSVAEATKHLNQHLEWRQKENVDQVLNEDWSDIEGMFPYELWARTRTGNPILYIPVGRYNFREAIEAGNLGRMKRFFGVKIGEHVAAHVRELNAEGNNEVVQYEAIFDLERDQSRSILDLACIECLLAEKDVVDQVIHQYPRLAENVYVVNAPPLFEYTFPWISGIVSEVTMHVLGSRDSYEPFLLKYIEKSQFPKDLKN